jgi:spore coat protein CotF
MEIQEKVMVADSLAGINASLKMYEDFITQTEHPELRQTLIQLRNADETSQYELFQIAKSKGYYIPAAPATPEEVAKVKNSFQA